MPVISVNTSRSAHSDGGYRTPCEPGRHLGNHAAIGAGTGSRGSLGDLKIVLGLAVMLAANAVSTETVH